MAKSQKYRLLHIMQHGDEPWHTAWNNARWQPRVDIYRNDSALLIHIEAPGIAEDDLRLHFEAGQLIVEGHRERPPLESPIRCLCVELEYGAFRRAIALPPDADGDNISARYQSGILLISVPFKKPAPPQSVRVSVQ